MRDFGKLSVTAALIAVCLAPVDSRAELNSAEELGTQAGAMEYCRDNFPADQKTKKQYDALRSAQIKDLDKLPDADKRRALEVAAMVGKKGNIGGKKLSSGRCEDLRKSALRAQIQGR